MLLSKHSPEVAADAEHCPSGGLLLPHLQPRDGAAALSVHAAHLKQCC